jgi:hypothetical protein
MTEKTFLLELRQAAAVQRNEECRQQLRDVADKLGRAVHEFAAHPTYPALEWVNGLWALAHRIMEYKPEDDAPGGAKLRVAA